MGASGTVTIIAPLPSGDSNELATALTATIFAYTEAPQSR
jgi:hypothetical protein